jgi:ribosomal protein S18 acetylase RimI-like enzyme
MLTEEAECLFEQHRFTQQFAEDVMRRDLANPLPNGLLPSGIRFATWSPAMVGQFFAVYQAAFQERPGYPDWSQDTWMTWLETDDDTFRSELSLLAFHDNRPVGFIICDEMWIIQMGVHPEWRGRGIGSALMIEVLQRFRGAGGDHVLLDVNLNNPGAARVYSRLGFERVGQRARYIRRLK